MHFILPNFSFIINCWPYVDSGRRRAWFDRCSHSLTKQLLLIQLVLQYAFAAVIYLGIVKRRGTTTASLVGYGLVLPLGLLMPFWLMDWLDLRNKSVKFATATVGAMVGFRTIEALFDTSPPTVEANLSTYVAYYSNMVHFEWDPKTLERRKITLKELLAKIGTVIVHFHVASALLSFEMHYFFQPFPSVVQLDAFNFDWELFSPAHLANAYLLGVLTFYLLSMAFELAALPENLKGYYTQPIFFNPLFTSRSPSEFWGRRWNLMIHRMLKYGAYRPARRYVSSVGATVVAFVASGLLHDYCWAVIFYPPKALRDEATGECLNCWQPILFKVSAFFVWNGVVLLLERPLARYFAWTRVLPTPIVSTLVLCTSLPVSHWYTGDWAVGGNYSDFAIALWHVKKVIV